MKSKSVLLLTLCVLGILTVVSQVTVANPRKTVPEPTVSAEVTSIAVEPPKPGESYRITYYNDGQLPSIEGVSTDKNTGQRYWSGPQDPGPIPPGKSLKDYLDELIDPASKVTVEIYGLKSADPSPPGGKHTMNPPWNTHCHRVIGTVIIHC